jgi:hypothetical protein
MGQNAQAEWRTTATAGASNDFYPNVWVKTTATLEVGQNRTFQIRQ